MKSLQKKSGDIVSYIENQEYVANNYVMKCFTITMIVYAACFLLNIVGIFIIEQRLMWQAFIPSLIIYFVVCFVTKCVSLSNNKLKYFILFGITLMLTITGVFLTYHVVFVSILPFLYATLYSSKPVRRYVFFLTVISTIVIVYGGYFWGLCDANMVLLTSNVVQEYVCNGQFVLTEVNENPFLSLLLFFVIPRCLIYIAFMSVCSSLFYIVSGSLEKAKLTAELERAKLDAEKARLEAEKANHAKSQFLASISHEIRTPINAVLGMNEMILCESKESHVREYAQDVKDSSLMLLNIVNEILDSSKIESGMMEIVDGNYHISSLLNDLYNMISIKAKEKKLDLIFDIDPNIPKEYVGDDKRIRQILLNLLTNAVKYTEQGKVTLKVRFRLMEEKAALHYSVKDTGIGIKEEDIGKIYDAFRRFDVSRNKNVEGTGLGMSIAQQLLKLMGSELKIESEYEKGSEFSFDIVQKVVNAEPLGDFRNRLLKQMSPNGSRISYIAPQAKILVVDDSEINLKVFRSLLKQTQMQIIEAESGMMCLELLKKYSFNLVFLDHMMPDMDGIETLHVIQENNLCKGVPVIMLTANAIVGDREKYISEGFDDFLSKPIIPYKLDQLILKHLPEALVTLAGENAQAEQEHVLVEKKEFQLDVLNELQKRLSEINFEKGLTTSSGDERFFLELLQDFVQLPIKKELTKYINEWNYKNYNIRIHGFKNSAYSIGAIQLGDLALKMEEGTREGLSEEIIVMQKSLFDRYDKICLQYEAVMSLGEGESFL